MAVSPSATEATQQIRFCRTPDGVRIAYASHGSGPPLVVVSCWLSHLQYDWQSPVWRHFLDDLGAVTTLVRYDERGFGLSDWTVNDFSLEARMRDLEAVIDGLGLDRFALMGMSGNSPVALAYAAQHPDRVTRLIMYGGWAGWPQPAARSDEDDANEAAYQALVRAGWARPDPIFRRVFTNIFIPDASEEQMRWFDDLQRMSTSTENMLAARAARRATNVSDILGDVSAPTLVIHARGDTAVSFEHARLLAAQLPDARLTALESRNHILLADEPAWRAFMAEVADFMEPDRALMTHGADGHLATLSGREREVLHLAADGLSNEQIANRLTLSVRTVERHLSNAYLKLGITGKAARTAAVARLLRHTD